MRCLACGGELITSGCSNWACPTRNLGISQVTPETSVVYVSDPSKDARIASLEAQLAEERERAGLSQYVVEMATLKSALAEMTARAEAAEFNFAKEYDRAISLMAERDSALSRLKAAEDGRWWKCPSCTEQTEMRDILNDLRCPCCGFAAPKLAASREEAVRAFAKHLNDVVLANPGPDGTSLFDAAEAYLASLAGKEKG